MDVDLLRPGTVPISPDTILWFEFLLNPSLLESHLSKPFPDPSATDLIIKFVALHSEPKEVPGQNQDVKIIDNDGTDVKPVASNKLSHKNIALKILTLKVAARLEWDLELFSKKLPLVIQATLLQDLFYFAMDVVIDIPTNVPENSPVNLTDQALFTLVLYHRWVLCAIVYKSLHINNKGKQTLSHNFGVAESNLITSNANEEIIKKLETQVSKSIQFLIKVLDLREIKPKNLTPDTFQMLTEDSTEVTQNWDRSILISEEELKCQICYDLAVYHILKEEYENARTFISQAKDLFNKLQNYNLKFNYCKIKKDCLDGYCLACQVAVSGKDPNLTQQLLISMKDQYTNILKILQADNLTREIPQVYRDNLEIDIEAGVANKKIFVARDLQLHVKCLNLVRRAVSNEPIIGDYIYFIKSAGGKGLDFLFKAFDGVLSVANLSDKKRIAKYLLYLIIVGEVEGLANRILINPNYSSLFNENELMELRREAISADSDIPELLLNDNWGIEAANYIQKDRIKLFELEQRLISSYDPSEVKDILTKIILQRNNSENKSSLKSIWEINNSWEIPIPLQSVTSSLPEGFLKYYTYILLSKSKELVLLQDFNNAKVLIKVADAEVNLQNSNESAQKNLSQANNTIFKLTKLLSWEMLLIEICHCLHAWPGNNICDSESLILRSKHCLSASHSTDKAIPRQEIIEHCAVFLLNKGEWEYLSSLEKPSGSVEFIAALSNAAKNRANQKFPKEVWDLVLAACKPNRDLPQKRSSSNSSSSNSASRDSSAFISSTFIRLREPTILNITISLLARIHNILRDESSLELHSPLLNFWPSAITNQKTYPIRTVAEYLFHLLTQALKYYPNNPSWLRLMGDLNFVLGYHESAMKYYLEAIIVVSDLFTLPIRAPIDDFVYRRMIKCCAHLQCYTQAVVLCQFLDEVDHTLAFKMAGNEQKNAAPADAMDAYYHCIWDTTILEYLINLHTKRGEHHRKQLAIKVIGQLELNSNNNEEIQREAAAIRKGRFLRALAKQYVY